MFDSCKSWRLERTCLTSPSCPSEDQIILGSPRTRTGCGSPAITISRSSSSPPAIPRPSLILVREVDPCRQPDLRHGLRAAQLGRGADLRLRSGLGLGITGAAPAGNAIGRCGPALVGCSGVYPASGPS